MKRILRWRAVHFPPALCFLFLHLSFALSFNNVKGKWCHPHYWSLSPPSTRSTQQSRAVQANNLDRVWDPTPRSAALNSRSRPWADCFHRTVWADLKRTSILRKKVFSGYINEYAADCCDTERRSHGISTTVNKSQQSYNNYLHTILWCS